MIKSGINPKTAQSLALMPVAKPLYLVPQLAVETLVRPALPGQDLLAQRTVNPGLLKPAADRA